MKIKMPAATLAALFLAATPMVGSAASSSHVAMDACVEALVTRLAARYGAEPKVRETRYPAGFAAPGEALQLTLVATDPRKAGRTVARASCTVTSYGNVLALETEPMPRL